MDNRTDSRATGLLPWIMAATGLILYLVTLNHWLSISTLSQPPYASNTLAEVARVSGWTWQPSLIEPLYWIITLPFHWLPAKFVPLALSLLSAVCATLTLWLLVRSVAILPHDRTEDQRCRERARFGILSTPTAWVPPAVAALVCGLQLSFWEHATVASGEIFKLLLFAYVIRCLLEYRLDQKTSWLYKASFVFSAALTNSWGMFGYIPLFITALIWLRRLSFFNLTFLSRIAICSLAGLLFYLLLPLLAAMNSTTDVSFWQALKYNLGSQKGLLSAITFNRYALFFSDRPLWVLALPSLLPLLFMGIRWPSYLGDPSKLGVSLATLFFHFFHAVLFVVCLWTMLDPQFSPRHLVAGTPLLSLYYLCALAVGYFTGYFLLIFGTKPGKRARPGLPSIPAVNFLVFSITCVLVLAAPAALIYRNLPVISAINGPLNDKKQAAARQYADACIAALPPSGAVIISDDIRRLTLVRSALTDRGIDHNFLFLDTRSLRWPDYHAFLESRHPAKWKNYVPAGVKGELDGASLTQVIYQLAQSNAVYYLHPSFGYYFEAFWLEPQGVVYKLNTFPQNTLLPPSLPSRTIQYNRDFWARADQTVVARILSILKYEAKSSPDNFADKLLAKAHLKKPENWDVSLLAGFYSRARNFWAVEVQKADGFKAAEPHFRKAIDLNNDNIVARINLAWNRKVEAGETPPAEFSKDVEDLFGKFRSWDALVSENGPFDEPRFCFEQGRVFVRGSLFRQAASQFDRTAKLDPSNLPGRLWLAQVYVMTQHPDQALQLIDEVRSSPVKFGLDPTNTLELMSIQTSALLAKNEPDKAVAAVYSAIRQQPRDPMLPAIASQMFMNFGHFTNALRLLDSQLKLNPGDPNALVNKGFVFLQLKRFEDAIPTFTRALAIETNETSDLFQSALFNRAIANLQAGKLDHARQDYQTLQKSYPTAFKLYYGLAEVAYRGKDTNAAIQNYQLYLSNAPTNTPEAQFVRDRLKELEGKASAPASPPPSAAASPAANHGAELKRVPPSAALNFSVPSAAIAGTDCGLLSTPASSFEISNSKSQIPPSRALSSQPSTLIS